MFCVAGGPDGLITSRHPTRGAPAWNPAGYGYDPAGLSCPSISLCVGAEANGVIVSTNPATSRGVWNLYQVDGMTYECGDSECTAAISGISCPGNSFCLGVDNLGNTITSAAPAAGPSSWTLRPAGLGGPQYSPVGLAVSCPSTRLCVVVSSTGEVDTSTQPTSDASAWSHFDLNDPSGFTGVSCRTAAFCVAVDDAGNVFTSHNPTGGASAWSRTNVNRNIPLNAVSCATRSLCVAVDPYGYATVRR
jgi:hypothetical protein